MSPEHTWHADAELLARYTAGTVGPAHAASVEAHLVACPSCRARMVPLAPIDRLERNLTAIVDRVEVLQRSRAERLGRRVGVPDHIVRLLVVSPAERGVWLSGVAMTLVVAVAADAASTSEQGLFALLVGAPLLPLVAIISAVRFRHDSLRELVATVPTSAFRLFLLRAVTVLAPAVAVAAVTSALVPGLGWEPALWLIPSLGLAASTLALGTVVPLRVAAWALGAGWVLAATVAVRGAPRTDLVESFPAFRPTGQLALLAVSVLAAIVVAVRRDSFEFIDVGRTT